MDASQQPSSAANGDSAQPVLTPDGRYLLFASSANNLVTNGGTNALPEWFPARLNVFLRDRLSKTTVLVSVNLQGNGPGNGDSTPSAISADGRFALLESSASNLVPDDTNSAPDVFLRDLATSKTILVSVNTNGNAANGASRSAVMTPDGRYVAFVSEASDIAPRDTNGIADIFVRDMVSGTTILASPGATSTKSPSEISASDSPLITPDGRFLAFYSTATNLVPGILTSPSEIYVRDLLQNTTICASSGAHSAFPPQPILKLHFLSHAISFDGQFVAYEAVPTWPLFVPGPSPIVFRYNVQTGILDLINTNSVAPFPPYESVHTLDMTPDGRFVAFVANSTNSAKQGDSVYVWDVETGISTLASGNLDGQVPTNSICMWPALDPSGTFVTFVSTGANLVTNSLNGEFHVYLRNLLSDSTILLDVDSNGVGSGVSPGTIPQLSADARTAVFECPDGTLFSTDRNHALDIVARDVVDGSTELVSSANSSFPAITPNGHTSFTGSSLSSDGLYVAFVSGADNLVANDTNGCADVFVRDLAVGTNILASSGTNGVAADASSSEPCMDGSGRYVAFTSAADNLVSNDSNHTFDVFVRDLALGTTALGSVSSNGVSSGNGPSMSPLLSRNGRFLLFKSIATDVAPGTVKYYGLANLFLRDLERGVTYALTKSSVSYSAMTPDGRYIAVEGAISSTTPQLALWDSQAGEFVYTNTIPGIFQLAISPDGRRIIYATNGVLQALDWALNTNWTISPFLPCSHPGLKFSADGRFMAFSAPNGATPGTNATLSVFVYDFQTLSNSLISRSSSGSDADGNSDSPDITPDGRSVAYRSLASNVVPGATNGTSNIIIHDSWTGSTTLLSASQARNFGANGISIQPTFSADGRTLVFESWASDIVSNDFNQSEDLFAVNFLYAGIGPASSPSPGFAITWQANPGQSYTVQFKQSLNDPAWRNATGALTNIGATAYFNDSAAGSGQRFYRIWAP
ncbi:MAG TPA: hypothetical protein VFE51_15265 [Verrucomicrobiae bacterium]|nr:hypothetical protein [Verrucomicrobiae bacterium]